MDRPLLHRRARAAQGRPQEISHEPYRLSHDRLWAQVAEWLGRGWSPLLISGRLRVLWPDDALMRVCPETIYRWVYSSRPLRERWARCPAARGHRRRRRAAAGGRRASRSPAECPSRTPAGADGRSAFGHWEADSVIGVGCNLHTEVERRTRFLMARIVPDKTAGESVGAQLDIFSPLPAGARVSVTHDNGTEFAHHERLRDGLGMATSPTRTPAGSGKQREPQRHDPPVSAQTLRDPDGHGKRRSGRSSTRSTTAPCACSATARPPRRSPTNC